MTKNCSATFPKLRGDSSSSFPSACGEGSIGSSDMGEHSGTAHETGAFFVAVKLRFAMFLGNLVRRARGLLDMLRHHGSKVGDWIGNVNRVLVTDNLA